MGRHERTARTLASVRRRGITLTGLAMIAAGLIWAAVAWASMEVQVDGLKGTKTVTVNPENSDVKSVLYNLPNGRTRVTGWSLGKVLSNAGIGEEGWTRIFIGGLEVRREEVFSGKREPVFAIERNGEGDDVFFIRPKKGDHPAEFDKRSNLRMNYRVPIEITPPLDSPETGETIKFEANAPGPESQYQFEWTASSGETGTGKTFEYTFPSSAGRVQINVEGERDGQTQAEQTIGTPVKAAPPENNGGSGGFGGTGGYGYDPGYSAPPSSDFDYNFPDSGGSESPRFPETPKTPDPDETPPIAEFGTSVEGELLSATAPLPPSSGDALPPDEEPPPDPEAAIEEAEEINAPGALIAAGVVVGLLGLGAGREMETVRPRRLRRPNLSGLRRLSPPWK